MSLIRKGFVVCFLLPAMALVSCRTPSPIRINGEFVPSSRNASEVLDQIRSQKVPVEGISGRARAQYSVPGNSERSAVIFTSDRYRTLMVFRNNLGIEGGRLLVEQDSVTFYNRIDQFAQKVSIDDHNTLFDQGFYAVNLLNLLDPDLSQRRPLRIFESDDAWRIYFDDQVVMIFDKATGDLLQYEMRIMNNFAFSTYMFGNFTELGGYRLPRSIQITTNDRRSNIFLQVQSYEINPPVIDTDLDIPGHIRVERP